MADKDSNTNRNLKKIYNKTERMKILEKKILAIMTTKKELPPVPEELKNKHGPELLAAYRSLMNKKKTTGPAQQNLQHEPCQSAASQRTVEEIKHKSPITGPAQQNLEHDPDFALKKRIFDIIKQKNPWPFDLHGEYEDWASLKTKEKRPFNLGEYEASESLKTKEIITGPAEQNLEHDPHQSAASQRIKHKNPWPYDVCESAASESLKTKQIITGPAEQNLKYDPYQSAARRRYFERMFHEDSCAKPKKISIPPHECHLCRRLKAKNKDEKSQQDVLNEHLSGKPLNREFKYLNTPPSSDDKSDEPFIYVSRIINSGTRKLAIEAHDFEYDSLTTIKVTRKDIQEQNLSVYPCLKREFSINNTSNADHIKNLLRSFETEEEELESLDEESDPLHEEAESLREELELQKRAAVLSNKLISATRHLYEK